MRDIDSALRTAGEEYLSTRARSPKRDGLTPESTWQLWAPASTVSQAYFAVTNGDPVDLPAVIDAAKRFNDTDGPGEHEDGFDYAAQLCAVLYVYEEDELAREMGLHALKTWPLTNVGTLLSLVVGILIELGIADPLGSV